MLILWGLQEMTDAPERIWAFSAPDISEYENGATIVAYESPQTCSTIYIREDLHTAALADAQACIKELEGQRVRVKPLVWEPAINNKPWHSAKAPWGWYYAQWDDEIGAWFASLEMGEVEAPIILQPSDVQTIDDAKSAAHSDYESRILCALET